MKANTKLLIGLAAVVGLVYFIFRKAQAQSAAAARAVPASSDDGALFELGAGVNSAVKSVAGAAAGVFKSAAPGGIAAGAGPAFVAVFITEWLEKAAKLIPANIKDIFSPNVSQIYDPQMGQWENKPLTRSMLQAPSSSGGG